RRYTPGQLTHARSTIVCNRHFAVLAEDLGLDSLFSSPELQHELGIEEATREEASSGKMLSDLFEAMAGAIFVDCAMDIGTVEELYRPLFLPIVQREFFLSEDECSLAYEKLSVLGYRMEDL